MFRPSRPSLPVCAKLKVKQCETSLYSKKVYMCSVGLCKVKQITDSVQNSE